MNLHDLLMKMGSSHTKIRKGGYSDLFHFNLKTKTLKNGNTVLVDNGKIIPQEIKLVDGRVLQLDDHLGEINEEFFQGLENRFNKYYWSFPSKTDKYVRSNFMAKNIEKMTYAEMTKAADSQRNLARYELEWFVLVCAINGKIPWKDGNYFWQSKNMPKLIIYKEWL